MKIVVGSQSAVKLDAVKNALVNRKNIEVVGVKANSGAPEQPIGDETLLGARNRAADARKLAPDADLYIAIENGIFLENGHWIDKAVVLAVTKDRHEHIEYSKGVEFDKQWVDEARELGFDTITVGKLMAAKGVVRKHDDPHADLGDKTPRAQILKEAVSSAVNKVMGWAQGESTTTAAQKILGKL